MVKFRALMIPAFAYREYYGGSPKLRARNYTCYWHRAQGFWIPVSRIGENLPAFEEAATTSKPSIIYCLRRQAVGRFAYRVAWILQHAHDLVLKLSLQFEPKLRFASLYLWTCTFRLGALVDSARRCSRAAPPASWSQAAQMARVTWRDVSAGLFVPPKVSRMDEP